jgi:hypothetical protein
MLQPMSCNDQDVTVERHVELPAPPEQVWEELPAILDEPGRVRVDDRVEAPYWLSFWWTPTFGDEPPSYVELELEPSAVGTLLHVRETMIDGAHLERSALNARAFA